MPSLKQVSADYPEVRTVLSGGATNQAAAEQITALVPGDWSTSEPSVRRLRRQIRAESKISADPYPSADRLPERRLRRDSRIPAWSPGIDLGQDEGEVRTIPRVVNELTAEPTFDAEMLRDLGLNPEDWEITSARKSRWQRYDGEWLEAFRASVVRRSSSCARLSAESIEQLLRPYARPRKRKATGSGILMVPVGDLQIGKAAGGGGTAEIIDRFTRLTNEVAEMIQARGRVDALILPWLGDCIEGLVSQGGKLVATLDVPISEQVRIYRRLMLHQIGVLAPLADRVILPVVPGNHDETYRQLQMPVRDSWAIEGASAVADALELSGRYEHVTFQFPERDELNCVLDIGTSKNPYVLGFTHGHLARQPNKVIDWWRSMSHGRQPIGQADTLVSGHFHHLRTEATGGNRSWIQIPALDGGSDWYRRKTGEDVQSGMISVELTPGAGTGWKNLTVHT